MILERISTIILLIVLSIAGVLLVQQKNRNYLLIEDGTRRRPYVKIEEAFKEPLTLWWPGISGQYPKYIVRKGMKGLGWEEFPVFQIKERLKAEYGVTIVDWMVSPSRLDREFYLNRRPVCIFPFKWSDPDTYFKKPQNHLLSYALDFAGDETLGILIRKSEISRYIDFIDAKGNLNLQKLIRSKKFKTAIVKGGDYSSEIKNTYNVTKNGDWKIKKDYSDFVHLMVASDNSQFLKMLNSDRFDFLLDHLITQDHFRTSKIDSSEFKTLIYKQNRVESMNDPQLIRYSIRCNNHPINKQIIPTLNKLIPFYQDHRSKDKWINHRKKFESYDRAVSIQDRFQEDVRKENWWFNKFNLEKDFGKPLPQLNTSESIIEETVTVPEYKPQYISRDIDFKVFMVKKTMIIVDPGYLKDAQSHRKIEFNSQFALSLSSAWFGNQVKEEFINILNKITSKSMSEKKLLQFNNQGLEKLVILGPSLNLKVIDKILSQTKKLKELHILSSRARLAPTILKHITPSITELSLVGINFLNDRLSEKLKSNQLSYLNLSGSMMMPRDLKRILEGQQKTIEYLILDNMKGEINDDVTSVFDKSLWTKLKYLKIENSEIVDRSIDHLIFSLGNNLEFLSLIGRGSLYSKHLSHLLNRCPKLKSLKVAEIKSNSTISFPPEVNNLSMRIDLDLAMVKFPKNLQNLTVETNFSDRGIKNLVQSLTPSLKELNLQGKIDASNLTYFLKNLRGEQLTDLTLKEMRLDDQHLALVAKKLPKLEYLNLSGNLISDGSVETFEKLISLKYLNINDNFVTDKFLSTIFAMPHINLALKSLFVDNPLKFNPLTITNNWPKSIEGLSIQNGQWYEEKVAMAILKSLPNTIRKLNWLARFDKKHSIANFIKYVPKELEYLNLISVKAGSAILGDFISSLPNTLNHLSFYGFSSQKEKRKIKYPTGLNHLVLAYVTETKLKKWEALYKHNQSILLQELPQGLTYFQTYFSQSFEASHKLIAKIDRYKTYQGDLTPNDQTHINADLYMGTLSQNQLIKKLNSNPVALMSFSSPTSQLNPIVTKPRYLRDTRLRLVAIYGDLFTDEFANTFSQLNLKQVVELMLTNSKLTGKGLVTLLNSLSHNLDKLTLVGSRIKFEEIDKVIELLPPQLMTLDISGSSFGQRGIQKFRDWQEKQRKVTGFAPKLIE